MSDQRDISFVQKSIDTGLSSIQGDPWLAQRIMHQERTEEIVKKKISIGFIIAIVLLLLTVTAIAISNWDALTKYFEKTRSMASTGELDRYSDEDQLKLLSAMIEAGLVDENDPRLVTAQNESLPIQERAKAANDIIAERYGQDYFSYLDIESIELSRNQISTADQAAYEEWSENNKAQSLLQPREPITETRVYRDVANLLTETGMFPRDIIRDVKVTSEYSESDKKWTVIASVDKEEYVMAIRRQAVDDGNAFSLYGYPDGDTWNIRFYLDEYGDYLGIYDAHDPEQTATLTLDDAYPLALAAAQARLHVSREELDQLTLKQQYASGGLYDLQKGDFRSTCYYSWYDRDYGDQTKYVFPVYTVQIDAENGQVVAAIDYAETEEMRQKGFAWESELKQLIESAGISASLDNDHGEYFWNWTVEERAAWSQIAYPIAQQYYTDHPECCQYLKDIESRKYVLYYWSNIFTATQFLYGVPDEQSISQEKAFEIARECALSQGARKSDIDDNNGNHKFYYDVTDPQRPLWKVLVNLIFADSDYTHQNDGTDPWGCFVAIDAHTGEIVRTTMRDVNTHLWNLV